MKALGKICLAIVIAFAFASCGSEKDNELGLEDLNYIYSKAYDDNEYWREFGYGYSSSDSSALELAKYDAYNALLLKALFNLYPNLQLNYDRSILADNNIAFDTIIKKNKNNYESYVALEVPIQVMEEAIKKAIEGSIITGRNSTWPYEPIYKDIDYRILEYKFEKEYFDKYFKEYKPDTNVKTHKLSDDREIGVWDEKSLKNMWKRNLRNIKKKNSNKIQ